MEPDIAYEISVGFSIGPDRISRKTVVRISHRDTGHDGLVLGDAGHLAHDIRSHDALAVDNAAKAPVPRRQPDAVAERAEIAVAHRARIQDPAIAQDHRNRRIELPQT